MELIPQIIGYQVYGTDRDTVLNEMAGYLLSKEMVMPTYGQAVIERENLFPTGIPSEPIPVAIPHSNRNEVIKTAILVGKVENDGVPFRRMDDTESEIFAKVIFMLAIDSNQGQLETLSRLMELVQDNEVIESITKAATTTEIQKIVEEFFVHI